MSKKIISLLLVLVMALSLVACSGNPDTQTTTAPKDTTGDTKATETTAAPEPKDPVTINYWYRNGGGVGEAQQDVEDELNRILSETPGYEYITIKLHPTSQPGTDITLQLADDPTQVDLISTVGYGTYDKVKAGEYLPLDDLIAANPEITADLPDWFVKQGVFDGQTYMIPNYQQIANTGFLYTAKDYLDKAGYTEEEFRDIILSKDFEKNVKLREDLTDAGRELGYKNVFCRPDDLTNARGLFGFSNNQVGFSWYAYIYWDEEAQEAKFSDDHEYLVKGYEQVAKWYDNGYIYQDASTDQEFAENGNFFHSELNGNVSTHIVEGYGTDEMKSKELSEKFGYDIVAASLVDELVVPAQNAAGGVAICSACQHPEEAAKVLALLFNKKYEQFYNTLVYGIEGVQYNKLTDTTVETLEYSGSQCNVPDCSYSYWKWCGGNTFNAWNNQSLSEESEAFILENINNNPNNITTLVGFNFDNTDVLTEIEQCTAIVGEYHEALRFGTKGEAGWEAWYNEYMDKMEKAGLRTVLDEYNRQVKEFLANK